MEREAARGRPPTTYRPVGLAEVGGDETPRADAREDVLAGLGRADEERELLLLAAGREVGGAVEGQRRGAVAPGEHLGRDVELVERHGRRVDARALDGDAAA